MDDHHSPPSSKKSSAISKVDLVDTPRMSPYRTRSRKNSNLTEENIAMHNESPSTTTRRVTRRMSQGSENANITLTPMPQAAKRSRRSPSVASDDLVQTPKKKFHVAQENVVMEEDEGLEENKTDGKTQSPSLTENGSAQVIEVVNSEVTTNEVDASMSAINKMPILNDSKQIDVPIEQAAVENEKVSKAAEESQNTNDPNHKEIKAAVTTLDSDTSNVPVEISTINSKLPETTEANHSEKLEKSASVASPMVQSLRSIGNSKSDSVSSPITSNLPESTKPKRNLRSTRSSILASNLEKSVSELISTSVPNASDSKDTAQVTDTVFSSPKELAESNFSLWLGEATNAKSDKFNSNVPSAPETLTKSTIFGDDVKVITIPDTSVRPMSVASSTTSYTPANNVSLVALSTTTPSKTVVKSTVLQDDITVPETPTKPTLETPGKTLAKTPSKAVSLPTQVTPVVKSAILQDDVNITVPETPTKPTLETPGKALAKTPSKAVSLATQVTPLVKSAILQDDVNITVPETPTKPTLETPGKALAKTPSKAVSLATQVTPLVKSAILQDDVNITVPETPTKPTLETPGKTLAKTPSKAVSLATQVTPLVKPTVLQDDVNITVLETSTKPTLETPGKTLTKTSSKAVSLTTQVTPPVKSTALQDEVNITVPESQKNPTVETSGKILEHTPSKKTESVLVQDPGAVSTSNQTEPILEISSKTIADTPSKTVSVVAQDAMDVSASNEGTSLNTISIVKGATVTNAETPSKTVQVTNQEISSTSPNKEQLLENRIENKDNEHPRWGFSVHRKSDGQPIDNFGMKKDAVETTLAVKHSTKKNTSIISVNDSSDDDGIRNEFINDEAEETNGEDSMDEEERKYLEEHEIPVDGISLGSDTDCEELSDENESRDSFIVSDSSNQLLDGSGDDLEIASETSEPKNKSRRSNKILDTSDEELEVDAESKKSSNSKQRSHNESSNKIDESSDESVADELANLDAEPKRKAKSKRLSDTISLSKKDIKRRSLHPNTKLNSDDLKDSDDDVDQNKSIFSAKESGEDDVAAELANLDSKPKKATSSKRLSDTVISSKKDAKRMSLHPNAKLNSGAMTDDPNKSMFSGNGPSSEERSKNDMADELANLDAEPKKAISSKRLSDTVSHSKKESKRLSLRPNAKLNSGTLKDDQNTSTITEKNTKVGESSEEDETEILANFDDVPRRNMSSKRLSGIMSSPKKDNKRSSLHPNTKLNCDGFESFEKLPKSLINESGEHTTTSIVPNDNALDKMEECNGQVDSAPSTSQQQGKSINFDEIQARCDDYLCAVKDAKREQKSTPKAIQEEKYQKLKEKKAMKLQEKKDKEARMLQQETLAAKQRQLKKEKKSKLAKITDEEKSKAIEKALAFSNKIKSTKNQHSIEMKQESSTETGGDISAGTAPKRKSRKRKLLQILDVVPNKKVRTTVETIEQEQNVPAKPEGFMIHSRPIPNKTLRKDKMKQRKVASTSAGKFTVEPMPKKAPSPFTVTTLKYSPSRIFKNKVAFNANIQRESAAQLLARKKKQKQLRICY